MSDFAEGSTLTVEGFAAAFNLDGTMGVTVNFKVTAPSGNAYQGQTYLWSPQGTWQPVGDLQSDLQILAALAKGAAQLATGVLR